MQKREKKSEQFIEIIYLCFVEANEEVGSQSESLCFPLVSLKNASQVMRDSKKMSLNLPSSSITTAKASLQNKIKLNQSKKHGIVAVGCFYGA